jgi:Resolvase, N terminal domain
VSGADPIEARPGFSALLDRLETNGVRTVVVEDASRFARDLVAQDCTAHRSHSPAKRPPIAGIIQHSERHPEVTRCGDELVVLI